MKNEVAVALPMNAEIVEYRTKVSAVMGAATSLVVSNPQELSVAEELLSAITAGEKTIVNRKEEITRPLMNALASGRALFKPFETDFAAAKKVVTEKILGYSVVVDAQQAEEQAKILKRVEKGTMKPETAMEKLGAIADKPTANIRTVRKLSIVDVTLIPREYMVPDRELITKALFAGDTVPGAELVEEKIVHSK